MRHTLVLTRFAGLSVVGVGVMLSIATSQAPLPSVVGEVRPDPVVFDEEREVRRFELVVEGTPEVLSRSILHATFDVFAHAVVEEGQEGLPEDGGPLGPEEAAAHPTAVSLEVRALVEGEELADGEASDHQELRPGFTHLSAGLPLELACEEDVCVARYEVTLRGPADIEATGPVTVEWNAGGYIEYELLEEATEDDYLAPEGAELSVRVEALEDETTAPE